LLFAASESYSAACEEMKLFFPDGLCCNETAELKSERIPVCGIDRIICKGMFHTPATGCWHTLDRM